MGEPVYVYVVASTDPTKLACKIGISKNPAKRLKALQRQSDVRLCLSDVVAGTVETAAAIERYAHWLLRESHIRGEWFAVDDPVAWRAVEEAKEAIALGKTAEFRIAGAGRPHLKPTIPTVATMVRIRSSDKARIRKLVGENQMAAFIREAIEEKLAAAEAQPPRKPSSPPNRTNPKPD